MILDLPEKNITLINKKALSVYFSTLPSNLQESAINFFCDLDEFDYSLKFDLKIKKIDIEGKKCRNVVSLSFLHDFTDYVFSKQKRKILLCRSLRNSLNNQLFSFGLEDFPVHQGFTIDLFEMMPDDFI
ncbi:MAG: hypothetical protein ACWA5R_06390, partial [bacterium]